MVWAYGSYTGGRILVLLTTAILARLLTPSEFGLVGFALAVTAFLDVVSDLGVSEALVIVRDDDEAARKANTAWTLAVILSVALTVIAAALGPLAASFFHQPELKVMLPVLGLNFLLRGLGVTHFALAQREIDFRTRTIAETADVVVRGGVGIGLALAGAGAYSLVGGYLVGTVALTTSLWVLVPFRPSPRLRRDDLSSLLRFGGGLTALSILSAITAQIDYLAIGRVLGQAKLGLYTLGFRLPELFVINFAYVAGMVLFPAFAGVDRDALASAFLTSLRYVLMVCLPLVIGLAVLAEPVVLTLFGAQWVDSITVMQVLSIFAFGVTLGIPAGTAYKSIGRVDILIKLAIPRTALAAASIIVFVDHGIVAVAACQAAVAGTFSLINIGFASRLLETGVGRICVAAWPPVLAGAVMAGALGIVLAAVEGPYATLAVGLPVGAAAYVGVLWLVARETLDKLWRTAFPERAEPTLTLAAEEQLIDDGRDPASARLIATGLPDPGPEPEAEPGEVRDHPGRAGKAPVEAADVDLGLDQPD
jgi:PST family polysaccharide transporter